MMSEANGKKTCQCPCNTFSVTSRWMPGPVDDSCYKQMGGDSGVTALTINEHDHTWNPRASSFPKPHLFPARTGIQNLSSSPLNQSQVTDVITYNRGPEVLHCTWGYCAPPLPHILGALETGEGYCLPACPLQASILHLPGVKLKRGSIQSKWQVLLIG